MTSEDDQSPLPAPRGPSELRRGDRALWTCPAVSALTGRRHSPPPPPGPRWTRDGTVLTAAAGRTTVHEDGALEMAEVQSSDAGQYRCGLEVRGGDLGNEWRWSDVLNLTILDDSDSKESYSHQQQLVFTRHSSVA